MTEERIRELAREHEEAHSWDTTTREEMLVQFAHEIIAEEREECARVCDQLESGKHPDGTPASGVAWECAAAIRAKGR